MNNITPDEQLQRDKEREAETAMDSLQKSDEDLLKEIFFCSNDLLSHGPTTNISRTIAHFSSLLVVLSRKAEKSTKKIVRLTWALFGLTAILLLVAIIQIIILI